MIYGDYCQLQSGAPQRQAEGNLLDWRNLLIQALLSGSDKLS
ncbi:MAG: hypothetical protein H6R17_3861 [Proteobacteria bacterium]|nr:hypothetical protein [Pseudomonadota bacterium]